MSNLDTPDLASDLAAEAALAGQWFDHLRRHSQARLGVTRASYGDGEQMAHDLMQAIGQTLGLEQRIDAAGNLYLTLPGRDRSRPVIMTGSHLDSVPEGGNYDGAAGVVAGMAMLARWRRANRQPEHDITVMGVRAESVVVPAPYIGSRAAFGLLEPEALDAAGVRHRPHAGQHMAGGFQPSASGRARSSLMWHGSNASSSCTSNRGRCWCRRACRSASSPASAATCAIAIATSSAATAMPAPSRARRGRTRCWPASSS